MGDSGMLEAIRWQLGPPASLKLLDQRLLPTQSVYIDIDGPRAAFTAIKVQLTCCDMLLCSHLRLHAARPSRSPKPLHPDQGVPGL